MNRRSFLTRLLAGLGAAAVVPFLPKRETPEKHVPVGKSSEHPNAWWKHTWTASDELETRHFGEMFERAMKHAYGRRVSELERDLFR